MGSAGGDLAALSPSPDRQPLGPVKGGGNAGLMLPLGGVSTLHQSRSASTFLLGGVGGGIPPLIIKQGAANPSYDSSRSLSTQNLKRLASQTKPGYDPLHHAPPPLLPATSALPSFTNPDTL